MPRRQVFSREDLTPAPDSTFREEYEHIFWVAKHGGGDEIADANCWLDVKSSMPALLDLAELGDSLVRDLRKHRYLSRTNAATVADAFEAALHRLKETYDH